MCAGKEKLIPVYSGYQDAHPDPRRLDADLECDFVLLSVWATEDDGNDTQKSGGGGGNRFVDDSHQEIYWGVGGVCVHPVYPPDSTELIPVSNLKDITVRSNKQKGTITRIGFTAFKFKTLEKTKCESCSAGK